MRGVSTGAGTHFLWSLPEYTQPVSCHWDPSHPPPLSSGERLIAGITSSGKSPLIAFSTLAFWYLVSHLSPPPLAPPHSLAPLAPLPGPPSLFTAYFIPRPASFPLLQEALPDLPSLWDAFISQL